MAARTGFPDTAFIAKTQDADFRIRYFSTRREVELCGHATRAEKNSVGYDVRIAGTACFVEERKH